MIMSVTHQGSLLAHLKSIFPDGGTGGYMEFDFWIPSHNLCFEFQDPYHYTTTWYYHGAHDVIHQKDSIHQSKKDERLEDEETKRRENSEERGEEKKEEGREESMNCDDLEGIKQDAARAQHMTLIAVPCWWQGDKMSLIATVQFERPDLLLEFPSHAPIPFNPPLGFFQARKVPDVGELMLASFPIDPSFKYTIPSNTWWIGEKYDGIRCCWNAKQLKVYARTGKVIELLPSMVASSKFILDCEIWFGRGSFASTYSLFAGSTDFVNWQSLRMISFDVASEELKGMPFEQRYMHLLSSTPSSSPFNINAPRILCKNHIHLSEVVGELIERGGEGVILRRCASLYENGRSSSLIKLKTSQGDKEGVVVDIAEDSGVTLKLGSGETFVVPQEDVLIPTPSVGEIVSFSFESHARRDVPVRPKIYRIRTDVSWEDISWNLAHESRSLNDHSNISFTAKPMGHWTMKNMRMILEEFAKRNKRDPLLPATWYTTSRASLKQFKDGRAVLEKFKGGYFQTVKSLFPEIGLDAITYYRYLWRDPNSRRKFFENYARENGFDSHNPDNWYKQTRDQIMAAKGANSVMFFHNKSVARALLDLYPTIGLDKLKCHLQYTKVTAAKRRRFFEAYAAKHEFDPLVPGNWYSQQKEKVMSEKGAKGVMVHYGGDVSAALLDLFPAIGLERSKLKVSWRSVASRRRFFEEYAKENQFDPLNPLNWYNQTREAIMAFKGASGVMEYHEGSVVRALTDLFPDVGLDASNFSNVPCDVDARKRFFQKYATTRGFNYLLPNNWYPQTSSQILSFKGAHRVLGHHNNSFSQALMELFPNIEFDKAKFREKYGMYSVEARRRLFEEYARENEFDPHNPSNWYSLNKVHLVKHSLRVLNHYELNPVKALMDLFPDIGLEKAKFKWN